MSEKEKNGEVKLTGFEKIKSFYKLLIGIAVSVAVYFIVEIKDIDVLTHIMIGWDTFSFCMIVMHWITFFIIQSKEIRAQAKVQDPNRSVIFIIILVSTLASFLAVLILLVTEKQSNSGAAWRMPIAVAGMLFSWFLIHTIFALRYAHIFYGDDKTNPKMHAGGLKFPEEDHPGYLDFAYFSFVLGMTFQVSDVQINSKRLRHLALLHGLIAFGFNTTMIALTINIIASLGS